MRNLTTFLKRMRHLAIFEWQMFETGQNGFFLHGMRHFSEKTTLNTLETHVNGLFFNF